MTVIWAGLGTGSIYALIALGYNITLVAGGVFNFAFANIVMLGCFITYSGVGSNDYDLIIAFVLSAVACGLVSFSEERLAIRPLRRKKGANAELVTTVGVATMITGALVLGWGSNPLSVNIASMSKIVTVLGGRAQVTDFALLATSIVAALAFYFWSHRTRYGLACLAQTEDREAAMLLGINVPALLIGSFVFAGIFGGLVAPLVSTVTAADASTSLTLGITGFIALTIGGVGSEAGAVIGGLALGLIQALTMRYLGASEGDIFVFVAFVVIVMIRPAGILGYRTARLV
jgi:branched-chain amino acid transport system permease protein